MGKQDERYRRDGARAVRPAVSAEPLSFRSDGQSQLSPNLSILFGTPTAKTN